MTSIAPPLPFRWEGDSFIPISPYFAKQADKRFTVGEVYQIEVREQRSAASHNHFFATLAEAHKNLPEYFADQLPTPDHLRRYALIKAGFFDSRSIVCESKAKAQDVAAFVKPMDPFAVVVAKEAVVIVYTAKSQSMRAMGKADFQRSKEAVLEIVAEMIGTSKPALEKHAREAA